MRKLVFLALLSTLSGSPSLAAISPPDPSAGVLDGRVAALFWPSRGGAEKPEFLAPEGCQAHLIPAIDLETEKTYPCGRWFRPPAGAYKAWLEGKDYISAFPATFRYVDEPFKGRGFVGVIPVIPAGRVRVADDVPIPNETGLRLISMEDNRLGTWQRAFDRRVRDGRAGAQLPTGKALAALFDRATGNAIAVSRPFVVESGRIAIVRPQAPASGADLLVVLRRPLASRQTPLGVALHIDDATRRPDAFLHAADTVIAAWYEVPSGKARVSFTSDELIHRDVPVVLHAKRVTTYRGELRKRPDLKVRVVLPQGKVKQLDVAVFPRDDRQPLRTVTLDGPGEIVVPALPPSWLRLVLKVDGWEFSKDVDLSRGFDEEAEFLLEPIVITGTVYLARTPVQATLTLQYGSTEVAARTDTEGRYEATLWRPGLYIAQVRVVGGHASAFIDPTVDVAASGTIDFHLPRNRITARVTDAVTGAPVADATIVVSSKSTHDTFGEVTLGHRYAADEKGVLVLPPLRPGQVEITATATNYREARETFEVVDTTEREIKLALRRNDESSRVRVVLPDGASAAGAEACVATVTGQVTWRGTADGEGTILVPASAPGDLFVVRHPRAACALQRVADLDDVLVLEPPAPIPLYVRSIDGGEPRPALLTIWIDGFRLTDVAMAFATWSRSALTDNTASWLGRNLPARSLRVLATRGVMPPQISSGAYDAFARDVPYPWGTAAIRAVVVE